VDDLDPKEAPCGGTKTGRAHFDSDQGGKAEVSWSIAHPDATANCTIKLCVGADADDCKVLQPTDGSGKNTKGKFPCGRVSSAFEGKEIRFPTKETCD
jgi:hypothetical protein